MSRIEYEPTHRVPNKDGLWENDRRPYYQEYWRRNREKRSAYNNARHHEKKSDPEYCARLAARHKARRDWTKETYGITLSKLEKARHALAAELRARHGEVDRETFLAEAKRLNLLTKREVDYLAKRRPVPPRSRIAAMSSQPQAKRDRDRGYKRMYAEFVQAEYGMPYRRFCNARKATLALAEHRRGKLDADERLLLFAEANLMTPKEQRRYAQMVRARPVLLAAE